MQWTLYHIPLLLGVVISFGLGALIFGRRGSRGGRPLLGLLVCAGLHCLLYALQLAHTSLQASLFWSRLTFPAFSFAALSFLLFAVEYTNREDWMTGVRGVLLTLPCVFASVAPWLWSERVYQSPWMGEQFGVILLRFEFGDVYVLVLGIVFTYFFAALTLVLIQFVRSGRAGIFQRQQLAIVGLSIPPLAALLQAFLPIQMALAPVSFVVAGLALTVAIFRYQLLDVLPIARQRVFVHVDAGVLVVGPNGRILDANPQAERMFADGDLVNQDLSALNVPLGPTDLHESGGPSVYERSTSGEDRRIYEIEHTPISDDYDQFNGWVVLFYDVTDREQRKRKLERQRNKLEETAATLKRKNERLDQFASVVSHDLRNPLNIAQGRLQLARESGDQVHFEKAAAAHDRMETMINELLTLARTDADVDETNVESVSLESAVAEAWEIAKTGEATLQDDIPQGRTIEAVPSLLHHILENLFRNAADHNEPPVTVRVGTCDREGFYVEDDGVGIPKSERDAVLEHGYTTEDQGTGFGLSIVQELVSAHGWSIQITEAAGGDGARFEITDAHLH